ncbi:hypothetical protein CJ255_09300 [Candidatus Viridilinea mediisalina]|uniref:ZU5 domain-containing protein n=1 Tax=Candidatus Viridilinea mediisalina TaxID=2024553 RepID=A0A2A6RKC1_9CHLR|nr:hypothetical protein CJ255_09300 [Candidatus Viridilinea mediisalina]
MGAPTASPTAGVGAPTASPTAGVGAPTASPTAGVGAPTASPTAGAGAPTASPTAGAGVPTASPTDPGGEAEATTDQLLVTAEQGGTLRSADGTLELTVPDGAVAGPTTLRYRRVEGMAPLPGFMRVGEAFELVATDAQGQAVRRFAQPLTLRVSYPAPQQGEYVQLGLYFSDAEHSTWTPLATTVDSQAQVVTAQVDHFTAFMTMAAAPDCDTPVDPALLATYQAAQATGRTLGCPVAEAYTWGGLLSQNFQHGARIVGSFYLGPNYKNAYEAAGGRRVGLGCHYRAPLLKTPPPIPITITLVTLRRGLSNSFSMALLASISARTAGLPPTTFPSSAR